MLISLIVPFYNLAAYVEETLARIRTAGAALGADSAAVEVICIDDGSTDATGALLDAQLASLTSASLAFRVIHQANGGEGAARNAGIAAATGSWLMFLDGDDVLLANALRTAADLARKFPEADIVSLRYAVFAEGCPVPESREGTKIDVLNTQTRVPAELLGRLGVFPTLFKRTRFADQKFTALPLGADRAYVMAALARANQVVVSDAVVEGYRVRAGSMARANWTVRKVMSLNDHAAYGLAALASSGKRIEPAGAGGVAALIVSEVPARLARLGRVEGRETLWRHWIDTVRALPVGMLPIRIRMVRRLILAFAGSQRLSVAAARICRALGLA